MYNFTMYILKCTILSYDVWRRQIYVLEKIDLKYLRQKFIKVIRLIKPVASLKIILGRIFCQASFLRIFTILLSQSHNFTMLQLYTIASLRYMGYLYNQFEDKV